MVTTARTDVSPRAAVKRFLFDVVDVVEKTYPVWEKRLKGFLEDTELDHEAKRSVIEINPVRHYYYAAVVGMEASRIRTLYPTEVAEDLLAEINELIDDICERTDHMVSDMVFDIIHRVQVCDVDDTKKPHDIAMRRIADLLRLTSMEETKDMSLDIVFRQEMGQPLALSVRHWWKGFKSQRQLAEVVPSPAQDEPADTPKEVQTFTIAAAS